MKIVILLFIVLILGSLGSALWCLIQDKGHSKRTVRALTFRIGLSIALFILLMASYKFGILS